MKNERCIILIDGSNFYFKLKDLGFSNLLGFDFSGFMKKLAEESEIVDTVYYVGKVRTDGTQKSKYLQAAQQKLLVYLKKHLIRYSLGYLMKSDGEFHEKGVDVNIAVDMLVATYDRIILVSSDTDLLPAVYKAKEKGKIVDYIGFSHKPSLALVAHCSNSRLFHKDDLLPFISLSEVKKTKKSCKHPKVLQEVLVSRS